MIVQFCLDLLHNSLLVQFTSFKVIVHLSIDIFLLSRMAPAKAFALMNTQVVGPRGLKWLTNHVLYNNESSAG
jgi:hypothetical protein